MDRTFWHGSDLPRKRLTAGYDGGVHVGTRAQAEMRNSAFLHKVRFLGDSGRLKRSKDRGLDWRGRIAAARYAGLDGVVYLNRYEGMSNAAIVALAEHPDPDRLSDAAFRKLVPDAEDSLIILDESNAVVDEILTGPGRVRLFHGTSRENAAALTEHGFRPEGWRTGGNGGRSEHLYLTNDPENAAWFAERTGDGAVIEVSVRACDLIVDPEDGIADTVAGELMLGTPGCLATRTAIPAHLVRMTDTPALTQDLRL